MTAAEEKLIDAARHAFRSAFHSPAEAFGIAPGRIEILGNHTDYNGGCVLAAAIDRYTVAAGRGTRSPRLEIYSTTLGEYARVELSAPVSASPVWARYVHGVWLELTSRAGGLSGAELVLHGNIPLGCGLSSSAALEAAVAMLRLTLADATCDRAELARLLQRAEHQHAGTQCGILDQFCALFGEPDRAILLDTAAGAHTSLPLDAQTAAWVLCDSGVSRELRAGAPYNVRVEECAAARAALALALGKSIHHLCSLSLRDLEQVAADHPADFWRRARHVIGEHERVTQARELLSDGRWRAFGALLDASQRSSQLDFENSCPELDGLCALAAEHSACWGSRLCGGGWGGCTLHLVEARQADAFAAHMREKTRHARGQAADVLRCRAAGGARGGRY